MIEQGRNITEDTPAGLKRAIGGDRIEVVAQDAADIPAVVALVARVSGEGKPQVDAEELRVHAPVTDRVSALTEVARTLQDAGIGVQDIGLRRPTLDEVFLHLTGLPAAAEPSHPVQEGVSA